MSPSGFSGPLIPAVNIVVLGESGVGKSSIVDKFLFNAQWVRYDAVGTSPFGTESTSDRFNVEVDGVRYYLLFNDINSTPIRLQQPGLVHSFQDKSLNVADGVLLLYDIGDIQSFDRIVNEGWEYACACRTGYSKFGCILVGNKLDLVQGENKEKRQVSKSLAEQWASMVGVKSFEVDRFDREKLQDIMRELVCSVKWAEGRNREDLEMMRDEQDERSITVADESKQGRHRRNLFLLQKVKKVWPRMRSNSRTAASS